MPKRQIAEGKSIYIFYKIKILTSSNLSRRRYVTRPQEFKVDRKGADSPRSPTTKETPAGAVIVAGSFLAHEEKKEPKQKGAKGDATMLREQCLVTKQGIRLKYQTTRINRLF